MNNNNTNDNEVFEKYKNTSMPTISYFLWKLGVIRWYRDGTFFSPSFRLWHPLTWGYVILFLILIVPICVFTEVSIQQAYYQLWEDLTVRKYFKENPEKIRWYNGH